MESIKDIMEAVNGVEYFKFSYANTDLGRLMAILREPFAQMGLWWEKFGWTNDGMQYWNVHKDFKSDKAIILHYVPKKTLIFPGYESTIYITNGECIVDWREIGRIKNDVPTGFFGSQSGTAFGRVLAQGHKPADVDPEFFNDFWEEWGAKSRCVFIKNVNLYFDGTFTVVE